MAIDQDIRGVERDMGSYTFRWYVCFFILDRYLLRWQFWNREHQANEVFVTGTFDDWSRSVKLEKEDGVFMKTVELPKTKVQYKVRTSSDTACLVELLANSISPPTCFVQLAI